MRFEKMRRIQQHGVTAPFLARSWRHRVLLLSLVDVLLLFVRIAHHGILQQGRKDHDVAGDQVDVHGFDVADFGHLPIGCGH